MMNIVRRYTYLLFALMLCVVLPGCREEDFFADAPSMGPNGEVYISAEILPMEGTRGIDDESKSVFENGELLHIKAVFYCHSLIDGREYEDREYGVFEYKGKGIWEPITPGYALKWPDEAVSGTFTAYYMHGSTGAFTDNTMPLRRLSSYSFEEVPLSDEVHVNYGQAVRLEMKHLFTYLKLTELREGISDQLWFSIPADDVVKPAGNPDGGHPLHNAFRFAYKDGEIYPEFSSIPSTDYKDDEGNPIVYIESKLAESDPSGDAGMTATVSYFLEPGVYNKFNLLYPRSIDTYNTYLSYGRRLSEVVRTVTGREDLKPNGRYVFSILKSLGVIVEKAPEQGWDKSDAAVKVDVEKFLRAANSGSSYSEYDAENDAWVEILEQGPLGSVLVRNVDFDFEYYDSFGDDHFLPTINTTFNGNYHYIQNLACPLFYQNGGAIINLGIRNVKTDRPLVSSNNFEGTNGYVYNNSYNGIIASQNDGTVSNVRVSNIDMKVQVITTSPSEATQESHSIGLLFGSNRGNVYDVALAGDLNVTVENYPGHDIVPRVTIGGIAGQNLRLISGVTYIDDAGFQTPEITVVNLCRGLNGVYKIGGVVGNHTGALSDIYIPNVKIESWQSEGLQSMIGGVVGESPNSTSGAPSIEGCIVRGVVEAGKVAPLINLECLSYAGGIAGGCDVQSIIRNCSISVDVMGSPEPTLEGVEYAEGGAFGFLIKTVGYAEGEIYTVSCFGSKLEGHASRGNFAGLVSPGYGWDRYKDKYITLKQFPGCNNVGAVKE